eukprot:3805239-Pyramimonas_sp.AAC.1
MYRGPAIGCQEPKTTITNERRTYPRTQGIDVDPCNNYQGARAHRLRSWSDAQAQGAQEAVVPMCTCARTTTLLCATIRQCAPDAGRDMMFLGIWGGYGFLRVFTHMSPAHFAQSAQMTCEHTEETLASLTD